MPSPAAPTRPSPAAHPSPCRLQPPCTLHPHPPSPPPSSPPIPIPTTGAVRGLAAAVGRGRGHRGRVPAGAGQQGRPGRHVPGGGRARRRAAGSAAPTGPVGEHLPAQEGVGQGVGHRLSCMPWPACRTYATRPCSAGRNGARDHSLPRAVMLPSPSTNVLAGTTAFRQPFVYRPQQLPRRPAPVVRLPACPAKPWRALAGLAQPSTSLSRGVPLLETPRLRA
jgi:hypothetical protein